MLCFQYFFLSLRNSKSTEGKTHVLNIAKIAKWLNKKGYLSVRGNEFKGNHVHSIVKKKRLKDKKLEKECPDVWSDFSLEVVDKTLVNLFGD